MRKTKLEFNPDFNTLKEVKGAAVILRELIRQRKQLQDWAFDEEVTGIDEDNLAQRFMDSFDTMTQDFEVAQWKYLK